MQPSFMPEQELEYRRSLLRAAARGNACAQKELEEEYHVRVYSTSERASYKPRTEFENLPASVRRKVDSLLDTRRDMAA